jgi:hypothetical protein
LPIFLFAYAFQFQVFRFTITGRRASVMCQTVYKFFETQSVYHAAELGTTGRLAAFPKENI